MGVSETVRQRLAQQRLTGVPLRTPVEVVAWLGAVQSQEYQEAKWSLGLRMTAGTDATVEQAYNAGEILRTHVMRPTWHFVIPADLGWLLELTAGRVIAGMAARHRQLELDAGQIQRSNDAIARSLEGGRALNRPELAAVLEAAGISTEGQRLPHLLMRAELDGVICSGPRQGKQVTYALIAERAPHARRLSRDEALVELVRRYFTGHGPARVRDFTWWSGLTVADAKAGLGAAGAELARAEIDGEVHYYAADLLDAPDPEETAFLLPTFDELLVGYAGFDKSRSGGHALDPSAHFQARVLIGGRVAASWRRTFKKDVVQIEIVPFAPLFSAEEAALEAAGARYARFGGREAQMTLRKSALAGQ